jgi:hypothetical protein
VTADTPVTATADHTLYAKWLNVAAALADALNCPDWEWTTGGAAPWFAQSDSTHDGVSALQSGTIGDDQETWVEATVIQNGELSFWWRVSCEPDTDMLEFSTNGVTVAEISGFNGAATNWAFVTCAVTASPEYPATLRWRYSRDHDGAAGMDAGWLDEVSWTVTVAHQTHTRTTPVPVPFAWLDDHYGPQTDYETLAHGIGANGIPVWQSYVAYLDPTDPLSRFLADIHLDGTTPVITWEPNRSDIRNYTIEGTPALTEPWMVPTNAASRFFRVKVELKN